MESNKNSFETIKETFLTLLDTVNEDSMAVKSNIATLSKENELLKLEIATLQEKVKKLENFVEEFKNIPINHIPYAITDSQQSQNEKDENYIDNVSIVENESVVESENDVANDVANDVVNVVEDGNYNVVENDNLAENDSIMESDNEVESEVDNENELESEVENELESDNELESNDVTGDADINDEEVAFELDMDEIEKISLSKQEEFTESVMAQEEIDLVEDSEEASEEFELSESETEFEEEPITESEQLNSDIKKELVEELEVAPTIVESDVVELEDTEPEVAEPVEEYTEPEIKEQEESQLVALSAEEAPISEFGLSEAETETETETETKFETEPITEPEEPQTKILHEAIKPDWYDWEVDYPAPYTEDILNGIGFNDKLLFIRELFNEDDELFSNTLNKLNTFERFKEATSYIRESFPEWDEESDVVYRFYMSVRRKLRK